MFKLNSKQYPDIELTFNDICDLEEKGIDITDLSQKNMLSALRGVVAIRFGGNTVVAGKEIEDHIKNGGSMDDLVQVMVKAVEKSCFFQALNSQPKA
jgi:hypothetical protein